MRSLDDAVAHRPPSLAFTARLLQLSASFCFLAGWMPASHACLSEAGSRYGISPHLLWSIARVESGLRPDAINGAHRRRTGTYDIGLMQINSSHLDRLKRFGIGETDLFDACTNLMVGAWILADLFARHGRTWEAVGAYNASCRSMTKHACQDARTRYAWKVFRHLPPDRAAPTPTTGAPS